MSNVHITPRYPHPRRRVRHKHATRAIREIRRVILRVRDKHDRSTRMSQAGDLARVWRLAVEEAGRQA